MPECHVVVICNLIDVLLLNVSVLINKYCYDRAMEHSLFYISQMVLQYNTTVTAS